MTGVVIGDGPMLGRIRNMIDRLHLEKHCRLTGFVPDYADVLRYMSGATIYVYLERDVPFGLTPLEASSLAVPVVAFEGGGVEETVIPGENGIKIPSSYGPDEIADLLHELLAAPEAERTRMGRRGQELARRWTWERSYDRFLEAADRSEAVDHSRRPSPCSPRDQ